MMGRMLEVITSFFQTRGAAPGKAVVVQTGYDREFEIERTTEMYHPPGISSRPTKGDRVIEIPVGTGVRIAIVTHNYRIEVEPGEGETIIYSTNADGDTVQSTIKLDASGNIDLNGDGKKFVTYGELNTALQSFQSSIDAAIAGAITGHTHAGVTTGPGTSGPGAGTAPATSLDISASETTTVRTGG